MLNELYTFAEPVQVVPFSSLKWGKFTLLHTLREIGFTEAGIKNNLALLMECQKSLDLIYELALIKGKSRTKKNPCGWCIRTLNGKLADSAAKSL